MSVIVTDLLNRVDIALIEAQNVHRSQPSLPSTKQMLGTSSLYSLTIQRFTSLSSANKLMATPHTCSLSRMIHTHVL